MMNKVFIAQEPMYRDRASGELVPKFDITPAAVYGDIEFLASYKATALVPAPIIQMLKHKLRNFNDDDYILPAGDPAIIAMVAMVAGKMNRGRLKILRWDKPTGAYITIQLDTGA